MSGILWGSQQLYLSNSIIIVDKENQLKCHATFESGANDGFKGAIYKYDPKKAKFDSSVNFTKCNDILFEVAPLNGKWQSHLIMDGEEVWSLKQSPQTKSLSVPNPLFSDCRYREDLMWLRKNDLDKAAQWKQWLEEQQRHDEKLHKK